MAFHCKDKKTRMIYRLDAATIYTEWQQQLDESVETGEALLIEFGVSGSALHQVHALLALEHLAAARADFAIPWLLVGGDGVTWMAALTGSAAGGAPRQSPRMMPLYGGADLVTYMAMPATLSGASSYLRNRVVTGLPTGMHALLIPTTQPGAALRWLSLPFLLLAQAQPMLSRPEQMGSEATENGNAGSGEWGQGGVAIQDPWVQWLALFIVIGLLIIALFV